jgi:hypothetical protein
VEDIEEHRRRHRRADIQGNRKDGDHRR